MVQHSNNNTEGLNGSSKIYISIHYNFILPFETCQQLFKRCSLLLRNMKLTFSCLTFIKRALRNYWQQTTQRNLICSEVPWFTTENVKNLIHYNRNASMFSVHWKSLYQSTKIWLCPDWSPCNNVLISVETDFDPRNEISVFHTFLPSTRRPRIRAFRAFKQFFWLIYKFLWSELSWEGCV